MPARVPGGRAAPTLGHHGRGQPLVDPQKRKKFAAPKGPSDVRAAISLRNQWASKSWGNISLGSKPQTENKVEKYKLPRKSPA